MHPNLIINISFTYIFINILQLSYLANVTDPESYLNVVAANLVHDLWSVEAELFKLPLKHVYTQIRL